MGLRDRLEKKLTDAAVRVADKGITAINSTIDAGARVKALADDPDQRMTIEALVLVFVETVRTENDGTPPKTRDDVKAAYAKRQKIIAWLSKAGPLGAATGSLAGLYNDAAILCNVADAHQLNLQPNDLAAHVLVQWQVMPTHERALAAMSGAEGQSVADYLKARWPSGDKADNPDQMSKRQIVVLLWKLRSARKAKVRKVESQVEAMIQDAEEQLGIGGNARVPRGGLAKLTRGLKTQSSQGPQSGVKSSRIEGRWTAEEYERHLQTLTAQNFDDGWRLWEWAEAYGSMVPGEALFEAAETVRAELEDRARGGWESRGARFHRTRSVLESVPAATTVFLPLGEQLYDAGQLAGPYTDVVDEADFASDGLMNYDPGPRRLDRLITLAIFAEKAGHPRAGEWRDAAHDGVASLGSVRLGNPVQQSIARLAQ